MSNQFDVDFSKPEPSEVIVEQIVSILQGIRFGSIEIVVHDGRIVQIDKHEKFRLKNQPNQH